MPRDADAKPEPEDDAQPPVADMASQLSAGDEPDEDEQPEDGEISLEELSQSYANVLQSNSGESAEETPESDDAAGEQPQIFALPEDDDETSDNLACPITPQSILEAILLVGRSDSGAISGAEIAALMRGVDEAEVDHLVTLLNQEYETQGRAIAIERIGSGYKLSLASAQHYVRDRFYGRVRDAKLNQAAIDCLALVAYQPGLSRQVLEEQRGQPSGGVLNQLVRRELLEIRREGTGKAAQSYYYPTDRLLQLSGLESLDDLPQVEDLD